jgi:PTS system galactitol-specific IIA component
LIDRLYTSNLEVLSAMGGLFEEYVDVRPGYTEALIQREREFPTGLPTTPYGVAIPHADGRYVIQPGLAVCTLKRPILFREMGNPQNAVSVKLAILIALPEAQQTAQVTILQWLLSLIQHQPFLEDVARCEVHSQVLQTFKEYSQRLEK